MQSKSKRAWLTPDTEDALAELVCRRFFVPDTPAFRESVSGALLELTYSWNWEQFGTMTPDEAALIMLKMYNRYALESSCSVDAPYWDDGDGEDADDEAPAKDQDWYGVLIGEDTWQEQLEDWFIAAFVAAAATPAAAIAFLTIAPKFRLAWKSGNWGAIVKIFIDHTEIAQVDTYSADPGLVFYDVYVPTGMGMANGAHELWVVHSGEHNPLATPDANGNFRIECIRKRLYAEELGMPFQLRQNPADVCQMQQSLDNGESWSLAMDFGLCMPDWANQLIQIVSNNNNYENPANPDDTFTRKDGEDENDHQARIDALCYAVEAVVTGMFDAANQVCEGQVTAVTLAAIATGIASAILTAFNIVTFGALTPLMLAVTSAFLAALAALQSLGCNVFTEATNRDALVCLMFNNLQNKPVSLANFQTAFAGNTCLTEDQASIAEIFTGALQNIGYAQEIYDNFLNVLGDASAAALAGATIPTCVCPDEPLDAFFTNGTFGWSPIAGICVPGQQTYETSCVQREGQGFVVDSENTFAICGQTYFRAWCRIKIDMDNFSAQASCPYDFTALVGTPLGLGDIGIGIIRRSDGVVLQSSQVGGALGVGTHRFNDVMNGAAISGVDVTIQISIVTNAYHGACNPCPSGENYLRITEAHLCP